MFKNKKIIVFTTIILICFASCTKNKERKPVLTDSINLDHFTHLFKEIELNGKDVGIVHIYSKYPNYEFEIEPNEGFTCLDDVARAIVMLSKYIEENENDLEVLNKMKLLCEFVLQMQNENGYFNNFIWNDLSINKTFKTSVLTCFEFAEKLECSYGCEKENKEYISGR